MAPLRLSVPLRRVSHPSLGVRAVRANLPLFVRTGQGRFTADEFRLDTGADIAEVGADWARARQVPFGGPRLTLSVTTGSGLNSWTGWVGILHVRVLTWGSLEYAWPCFFREHRPPNLPPQLALAGVLDDLELMLTGTRTPAAPHGSLIVIERGTAASAGPVP